MKYDFACKKTDWTLKNAETEATVSYFSALNKIRADGEAECNRLKDQMRAYRMLAEALPIDTQESLEAACRADECEEKLSNARKSLKSALKEKIEDSFRIDSTEYDDIVYAIAKYVEKLGFVPGEITCHKIAQGCGVKKSSSKVFCTTGKMTAPVGKSKINELVVLQVADCLLGRIERAAVGYMPKKWLK